MLAIVTALVSRNALAIAACIGLLVWTQLYLSNRDAKVEARTVATVEKATDNATKKGKRAADRSASPGLRGTRDPTTRDD